MCERLYQDYMWSAPLPEPFDLIADKTSSVYISKYNTSNSKSTLFTPLLRAIISFAKLQYATETGESCKGAIGKQGEDIIIAEYESNIRTGVVFNRKNQKFIVGLVDSNNTDSFLNYSLGKNGGKSGSALFFALMPIFLEDKEFEENYDKFYDQMKVGYRDPGLIYETGCIMCDNVYRRIKLGKNNSAGIEIEIPTTNNIHLLTYLQVNSDTYNPDTVIYGEFSIFKVDKITKKAESIKAEEFIGQYKMSSRVFSKNESDLIPELPTWYQISPEAENICKHIKETFSTNMPVKNIMLRGPAGTGKTETAKAIAAGLGLPYMFLTCSANTEVFDLTGQILPEMDMLVDTEDLPSFYDIKMDPGSVYCSLTGEYKEDANEEEVYELLLKKVKDTGNLKQGFKYVETPLVKAVKYGYCIEIQEPSVISNPGVLVGLNGLLDRGESITLPTGEVVKRHPECIVIITTNNDYEGCKAMNQSVISRMNMIYDMEELPKGQLVSRVMSVTGYDNKGLVDQMADVVLDIVRKRKESMITDGSCGVREFIAWVQSTMITGDPFKSALNTIIPLATADPECRTELIDTCLSMRIQQKE